MSPQDDNIHEPANTQPQVEDDNDAQAQYTDDGMGSPVRQFAPRGRSLKTKTESADAPKRAPKVKAAPKTASKIPAKENVLKKRKTTADESTSSVKVSKRAKTMAAEGAAKASVKTAAAATKVPKGAQKDAYDRVQDALAQLEEHEVLVTSMTEEDVEGFLARTRSDDGYEVEEIDDADFSTSPAPAPDRRQSGRGMSSAPAPAPAATSKELPQYAAVAPWGSWAIAPRDRARADGKNIQCMVEVEKKLKDYYLVPFAVWWAQPKGTHTKYTGEKRYGVQPEDPDAEDRKVTHAVLEGYSPGEKAGRMCNGWKSEKSPWSRVEYKTVDFYLQKKDLPADWTPPGIEQLRALSRQ